MFSSSYEDQDEADNAYRQALEQTGKAVRANEAAKIAAAPETGGLAVDHTITPAQPVGEAQPPTGDVPAAGGHVPPAASGPGPV